MKTTSLEAIEPGTYRLTTFRNRQDKDFTVVCVNCRDAYKTRTCHGASVKYILRFLGWKRNDSLWTCPKCK